MAFQGCAFLFWGAANRRKVRVKVGEQLREIWRQATGAGRKVEMAAGAADAETERRTLALPSILSPVQFPGRLLPKPTPIHLRRFAETPVVRRAINVIKDRIAAMDWQVRVRRGVRPGDLAYAERKLRALRRTLEEPNASDSFRTLIEQVIEDMLTGGYGAIEMEPTGDGERPAMLWPWMGLDPDQPPVGRRGGVAALRASTAGATGVGRHRVAGRPADVRANESAQLYALWTWSAGGGLRDGESILERAPLRGKLAANSVAQYALWLNEATPAQHDRLIRWWQDEIEGTGRVPLISTEQKPEVLRFAQGTDADMRLEWQEFLIRMVANAFGLPPLMLGLEADVNQSTPRR